MKTLKPITAFFKATSVKRDEYDAHRFTQVFLDSKAAVTHNKINETVATVKKRACLFH